MTQIPVKNLKRQRRLAKFKAALKIQKQKRLLGLSTRTHVTFAY